MAQAALYPLSLTISPSSLQVPLSFCFSDNYPDHDPWRQAHDPVLCYNTDKTDIHPDLVTPFCPHPALILLIGSKPYSFHPHPHIESSPLSPRPKIHFSWASSFIVARSTYETKSNAKPWRFVMIQICV